MIAARTMFLGGIALALCVCAGAAPQPTTRPAIAVWSQTLADFAQAMAEGRSGAAVELLTESAAVQGFDGANRSVSQLMEAAGGAVKVGAHAYIGAPATMAEDLAGDARACGDLPEAIQKELSPEPEAEMQRSNRVAGQWVAQTLQVVSDRPVAVILLWRKTPRPQVVFVLMRGQEVAPGRIKIDRVAFGSPRL